MECTRKAISKKTRFDVFKRDGFKCLYCGDSPPKVNLEVDHVISVKDGGENDINNLVTSCFDCNRGKGAVGLGIIPLTLQENIERIKEREDQVRYYDRYLAKIRKAQNKEIDKISAIYEKFNEGYTLTDSFKNGSIKRFLEHLTPGQIQEAMTMACEGDCYGDNIKYFCGICWRKIKNG